MMRATSQCSIVAIVAIVDLDGSRNLLLNIDDRNIDDQDDQIGKPN